jgi:transcriptional regulator with XRE-family HTH domain
MPKSVAAQETESQKIFSPAETDSGRGCRYTRRMAKNRPFKYPFREEDRPNRIYYWRKAREMTLEELGGRCGMTRQTLNKYETGRTPLTFDTAREIARGLDVTLADLLPPKDNPGALSAMEKELVEGIRSVPPESRGEILAAMRPIIRLLAAGRSRPA